MSIAEETVVYTPGRTIHHSVVDLVQGDEWNEIIFHAHKECWVYFHDKATFGKEYLGLRAGDKCIERSVIRAGAPGWQTEYTIASATEVRIAVAKNGDIKNKQALIDALKKYHFDSQQNRVYALATSSGGPQQIPPIRGG